MEKKESKKEGYVIALYMRVSKEDGEVKSGDKRESGSIVNQRGLLRAFVEGEKEFCGCAVQEWCDDGYSGTNFRRPAMEALLQKAGEGKVNCIIVKDFSRFGRDYLTVSDYVEQIFPFLGIRFISVNDGYDSSRDTGAAKGMEMAFRNIVYGWYSRDISEKEKTGRRARAQKGDYLSAFAPIGYEKDKKNKNHLIVEMEGAEIVRRIFLMAGAGFTVKEIARLLNGEGTPTPSALKQRQGHSHPWWEGIHGEHLWDLSSITRILRDERYLGTVVYGKRSRQDVGDYRGKKNGREKWVAVSGCHEPIVTEEEFQKAQDMLKKCGRIKARGKGEGAFQGKVRCGVCGYAMAHEKKGDWGYRCRTGERTEKFSCMAGRIAEGELADVVQSIAGVYEEIFLGKRKGKEEKGEKGAQSQGQGQKMADSIKGGAGKAGIGKRGTGKGAGGQGKKEEEWGGGNRAEGEKQARIKWEAYSRACRGISERRARLYEKMLEGDIEWETYVERRDLFLEEERKIRAEKDKLEKGWGAWGKGQEDKGRGEGKQEGRTEGEEGQGTEDGEGNEEGGPQGGKGKTGQRAKAGQGGRGQKGNLFSGNRPQELINGIYIYGRAVWKIRWRFDWNG